MGPREPQIRAAYIQAGGSLIAAVVGAALGVFGTLLVQHRPQPPSNDPNVYMVGSGTVVRYLQNHKILRAPGIASETQEDRSIHILEGATGSGLRFLAEALVDHAEGYRVLAMASRRARLDEFDPLPTSVRTQRRVFALHLDEDAFEIAVVGARLQGYDDKITIEQSRTLLSLPQWIHVTEYSGHHDHLFRRIMISDSGDRDHSSERSDEGSVSGALISS